jgi:uncharacterized protein YndB with AHSA1/START domain
MTTRTGSATVELPSDTEILITREFDAPADLLFEAWANPVHVPNWWGFEDNPMILCEIDLRVGGSWRFVVTDDEHGEFGWHGVYQEIERPNRLVSTEVFEGYPDAESLNTVTLDEAEGVTTMRTRVLHKTKENRDGHIEAGMEEGMQITMNRLDAVLETLKAGAS